MGLEEFTTESSSSPTSSSGTKSKPKQPVREEFPKVFWNGKESLSEGYRKIRIEEEERWDKIITFIEEELGIDEEELRKMEPEESFNIIQNTINKVILEKESSFEHRKECPVCGSIFEFPENWDFIEYQDESYCEDHTLEEVKEANEDEE